MDLTFVISIGVGLAGFITVFDHSHVVLGAGGGVEGPLVVEVDLLPTQVTHQLSAGGVVGDVSGGQRSQSPVELDLGSGQVSRHEVSHSSAGSFLVSLSPGEGDHPPVVQPHVRIISTHSYQLRPAGADGDALHLSSSANLNTELIIN